MPGRGHDYIGNLNETVNPSNGSLSLRINVPTPQGRGLSLPFQFSYNSNGIIQMFSTGIDVTALSNRDSRYMEQGGWGFGLPLLTVPTAIQLPGNNPHQPSATCPVETGFVFTDPSGTRHALGLALANNSVCNSTGVAPGYSFASYYAAQDNFYSAWTTSGGTPTNDVQSLPFNIGDLSGTYYHFPYLAGFSGCLGYCNIPDCIEDRNGNVIRFSQNATTGFPISVTDTAGRQLISIPSFGSSSGDQITISGVSANYVVHWQSISYNFTISANGSGNSTACFAPGTGNGSLVASGSMKVVSSITLPNGQSYQFQYDPAYGLLNKIIYPNGGYVSYTWGPSTQYSDAITYNDSLGNLRGCTAEYKAPAILHRYVSYDGTTTAEQQDFSYATTFTAGTTWNSKQTTVMSTDLVRAGHPAYQTTYTYSAVNVGSPPDVPQFTAQYVPVENTITYKNPDGTTASTVTKTWQGTDLLLSQQTNLNGSVSKTVFQYFLAKRQRKG